MTRTLRRSLLAALAATLLLCPPAFAGKGFSFGVTAGEVSSSSAILWAHAKKRGRFTLQVASDSRFRRIVASQRVRAIKGNDYTMQARVGRLEPGKRHYYRFRGSGGRRSDRETGGEGEGATPTTRSSPRTRGPSSQQAHPRPERTRFPLVRE